VEGAVEVEGENGGGAAAWRVEWFHESLGSLAVRLGEVC
jgi:hypothetical protein